MRDWFVYSVLAIIFWGIWVILPKFAIKYIDVKSDFIYQTLGGFIIAIFLFSELKFNVQFNFQGFLFAFLAGISGGLGTYYFLKAMEAGNSLVVIPLTSLYPIIGVALSIFLFKEIITIKQIIGIIFAMISVVLLSS